MKIRKVKNYEMDMTQGALLPKMLVFTYPLVLMGMLQLLYNAVDTIVVGKFAGSLALAAIGSTGSIVNLMITVFMGLSVGTSVCTAHSYAKGDHKSVHEIVHTSITLSIVCGVFVGIVGFVFTKPLLLLMDCPLDVIDGASIYMKIIFIGTPINLVYNFAAAILRAIGDTKRPLYFLMLSGVVNVALNLIFVIVFNLDEAGVALATVISQAVGLVLILICLINATGSHALKWRELKIYKDKMLQIIRIGIPAGVQGSMFGISNVIIQSSINSFGAIAMAGTTAASNIEGFCYIAMNAVHQTAVTFSSQNTGANKPDRVRKTLWLSLTIVTVIGGTISAICTAFGSQLLSIYDSNPDVIAVGLIRFTYILMPYFICGVMDVLVGQLRGMGYAIMPTVVSIVAVCVFRLVWIYTVFASNRSLETLFICYPLSWLLTVIIDLSICIVAFMIPKNRFQKK